MRSIDGRVSARVCVDVYRYFMVWVLWAVTAGILIAASIQAIGLLLTGLSVLVERVALSVTILAVQFLALYMMIRDTPIKVQ